MSGKLGSALAAAAAAAAAAARLGLRAHAGVAACAAGHVWTALCRRGGTRWGRPLGTSSHHLPTAGPACSPAGTYSGEGATECTLCPAGQYNPLEGLPDQTDITGVPCILCAEGSVALTLDGNGDDTALSTDPLVPGATYCEAW